MIFVVAITKFSFYYLFIFKTPKLSFCKELERNTKQYLIEITYFGMNSKYFIKDKHLNIKPTNKLCI